MQNLKYVPFLFELPREGSLRLFILLITFAKFEPRSISKTYVYLI